MRNELFKGKTLIDFKDCIKPEDFQYEQSISLFYNPVKPKTIVNITDNAVCQINIDGIGDLYDSNINKNLAVELESCVFNEVLKAINTSTKVKEKDLLISFDSKNNCQILQVFFRKQDSRDWTSVYMVETTTDASDSLIRLSVDKAFIDSYKNNFLSEIFGYDNKNENYKSLSFDESTKRSIIFHMENQTKEEKPLDIGQYFAFCMNKKNL